MKRRAFLQGLLGFVAAPAAALGFASKTNSASSPEWIGADFGSSEECYVAVIHPDTELELVGFDWHEESLDRSNQALQWPPEVIAEFAADAPVALMFNRVLSGGTNIDALRQAARADLKAQGVSWA